MHKKNVFVAMGGYSTEHDISIQSGKIVCQALDKTKYNVFATNITQDTWYVLNESGEKSPINKEDFSFTTNGIKIQPDVVFNTIHGNPGEDGVFAAYLELLKIPQTSSNFYEAALSFNKRDCLSVLKNFGVKCANSYYINKGGTFQAEEIIKTVGLPCFVKPNRAGSSFGISKVNNFEGFKPALEKAFAEDNEVLIETALVGTEVSIGAYRCNEEIVVLMPTEIVSENDFFDYEAKYLGKSQEITPARISNKDLLRAQNETRKVYHLLNLKGVARAEFIIQNGVPYFLEVNTTPGLSAESIIPKQVEHASMSLSTFFEILVEEVLA